MIYKRKRKPLRWEKECMAAHNLKIGDWLVLGETEFYLKIVNKENKTVKSIDKFRRMKRV